MLLSRCVACRIFKDTNYCSSSFCFIFMGVHCTLECIRMNRYNSRHCTHLLSCNIEFLNIPKKKTPPIQLKQPFFFWLNTFIEFLMTNNLKNCMTNYRYTAYIFSTNFYTFFKPSFNHYYHNNCI